MLLIVENEQTNPYHINKRIRRVKKESKKIKKNQEQKESELQKEIKKIE